MNPSDITGLEKMLVEAKDFLIDNAPEMKINWCSGRIGNRRELISYDIRCEALDKGLEHVRQGDPIGEGMARTIRRSLDLYARLSQEKKVPLDYDPVERFNAMYK